MRSLPVPPNFFVTPLRRTAAKAQGRIADAAGRYLPDTAPHARLFPDRYGRELVRVAETAFGWANGDDRKQPRAETRGLGRETTRVVQIFAVLRAARRSFAAEGRKIVCAAVPCSTRRNRDAVFHLMADLPCRRIALDGIPLTSYLCAKPKKSVPALRFSRTKPYDPVCKQGRTRNRCCRAPLRRPLRREAAP